MDANSQNINHLVMDLHLLDSKLENEMLPSVSCNNNYGILNICIMKYNSVFILHMLLMCFTGSKPTATSSQVVELSNYMHSSCYFLVKLLTTAQ